MTTPAHTSPTSSRRHPGDPCAASPGTAGLADGPLAPGVTLDHVGYAYRPRRTRGPREHWALEEVTLTFRPGAVTGLLGRNGAGKSTLLSLVAGLRRPTTGTVSVGGTAVLEDAAATSAVALLGGRRSLIENARIDASLRLWAATRPGWDQEEALRLLDAFEIPRRSQPQQLSTGRRSALDAVLALACHAPVLLLDEVHQGMDAVARRTLWEELLASYVRDQQTVVISSHHIEEVADLLEDVVILDHGRVLRAGPADEVRSAHAPAGGPLPSLTDVLVDLTESSLTEGAHS